MSVPLGSLIPPLQEILTLGSAPIGPFAQRSPVKSPVFCPPERRVNLYLQGFWMNAYKIRIEEDMNVCSEKQTVVRVVYARLRMGPDVGRLQYCVRTTSRDGAFPIMQAMIPV